jgi:rhodanese-related sulfurtransferase
MKKNRQTLLLQMLGFIVLAILLGLSAQPLLPNGISPITDITLIETDSGSVAMPSISINPSGAVSDTKSITLKAAHAAFQKGEALFLDARELEAFQSGHIQGAVHLPVEAFMDSLDYLDTLEPNQLIITYCDGADCNASIDLAGELNIMGFTNIHFFFGGWQEWTDAGYPIEGGQ